MTGPIIAVMEPGTFEAATKGFIFLRLGAARGLQVGQSSFVILFNTSASLVQPGQSGEVGGIDNEKVRRCRLQSRSIRSAALFPFSDVVTEHWTVLIPFFFKKGGVLSLPCLRLALLVVVSAFSEGGMKTR